MESKKGQRSLELLGAWGLLVLAIIIGFSSNIADFSAISKDTETAKKYYSAMSASDKILQSGNYIDVSNPEQIVDDLNQYSDFQHSIRIFQFKIINFDNSTIRNSGSEWIKDEPNYRKNAENRIIYGTEEFKGIEYHFINTAYDGEYDTLYYSIGDSDFSGNSYNEGDIIFDEWEIEEFQNRDPRQGYSVILKRDIVSTFNKSGDNSVKLNRYGYKGDRLIRLEVLTW